MRPKSIGLEDHRDAALLGRRVRHVFPEDEHVPGQSPLKTGNCAQQSCLAAARAAEHGNEFALPHCQIDAVQNGHRAVPDRKAAHLNRRNRVRHREWSSSGAPRS
jgi:hypothetical protein